MMNIAYQQLSAYLPWFIIFLAMAVTAIVLGWRLSVTRHRHAETSEERNRLQTENQLLSLQLAETQSSCARERAELEARLDEIFSERKALENDLSSLQKHSTITLTQLSAAEAKLSQLSVMTERLEKLSQEYESLRLAKSVLDSDFSAQRAQLQEERKAALEKTSLLEKNTERLVADLEKLKIDFETLRNVKAALDNNLASQQAQLQEERKAAIEKIQMMENAEARLTREFENVANRIFDAKQQKFNEVSKNSVELMLQPVREQLKDFRTRVDEVYDQENKERASLLTEIRMLKSLNERISTDALNLTRALKGESKTRGNWGEMQLERLLEESGLVKGREYEVQVSLKTEEGQRLQPDVVVHLPEKKDVIIDAKVSLVAYEQFHSSEKEEEKQRQLRQHIAALRQHFKQLSAKNYEDLLGVNSLDLVIMFVPVEPALLIAFEHEPTLFSEAFNLGILIVCPSTLMATLQIIHNIWRYEYQNQNALLIANEAGRLHDQFVLFLESMEKVGEQLQRAGESFEMARKRLISGKGNLVARAKKLQNLGARTKKNIDNTFLEMAAADDEEPTAGQIASEATGHELPQ